MSELPINPGLVARSYDTNHNGKVSDELKVKADAETLRAVGGDAEVTVDELTAALKNDNVIIKNGEIQSNPDVALRIPLMLDGYSNVQREVSQMRYEMVSHTQPPEKTPYEGASQEEIARFNQELNNLNSDYQKIFNIANDGMLNLSRHADKLNDKTLNNLAEQGRQIFARQPDYPKTDNPTLNRTIYANQQHAFIKAMQGHFQVVADHLNKFDQPLATARSTNQAIGEAQKAVDREHQAVANKGKAVGQLKTEIKEIDDSWNPLFRETRKDSRKETIKQLDSQIDPYTAQTHQDKLEKLARTQYESVISALDGFDFKEAAGIKAQGKDLVRDAETLRKQADKNAELVEDALD